MQMMSVSLKLHRRSLARKTSGFAGAGVRVCIFYRRINGFDIYSFIYMIHTLPIIGQALVISIFRNKIFL